MKLEAGTEISRIAIDLEIRVATALTLRTQDLEVVIGILTQHIHCQNVPAMALILRVLVERSSSVEVLVLIWASNSISRRHLRQVFKWTKGGQSPARLRQAYMGQQLNLEVGALQHGRWDQL